MRPRNGLRFRARPRERHAGRSVAHGEARAKHSGSGNTRLISSSRDALATARACLGETRKGGGALGAKSARLRGEDAGSRCCAARPQTAAPCSALAAAASQLREAAPLASRLPLAPGVYVLRLPS